MRTLGRRWQLLWRPLAAADAYRCSVRLAPLQRAAPKVHAFPSCGAAELGTQSPVVGLRPRQPALLVALHCLRRSHQVALAEPVRPERGGDGDVDLKLVLLGASRRTHPGQRWRGAALLRCGWRRARLSVWLQRQPACCALWRCRPHPPPLPLLCAGQPGVGKTCLVYRYLYNTFGETISARPRLPPRLTPAAARAAPRHTGPAKPCHCHPPVTRVPPGRPSGRRSR